MYYLLRHLWPLAIVVMLTGCGDTYRDFLSEEAALANEFADGLLKVVDEPSANYVQKYLMVKLRDKFKTIKDRKDRFDKNTGINRLATLQDSIAGATGENTIDAADFTVRYSRVDKETVKVEIVCNSASILDDIKMLANPETHKHYNSIRKRIDQQIARIDSIVSRLKVEKPSADAEWATLATFKKMDSDVFGDTFPKVPKIPIPYESFSNAVRIKPSS